MKNSYKETVSIDFPEELLISFFDNPSEIKEKVEKKGKTENMLFGKREGERSGVSYSREVTIENGKVV